MKSIRIKKLVCLFLITAGLNACSHKIPEVGSPCPDFGRYCSQKPIN